MGCYCLCLWSKLLFPLYPKWMHKVSAIALDLTLRIFFLSFGSVKSNDVQVTNKLDGYDVYEVGNVVATSLITF